MSKKALRYGNWKVTRHMRGWNQRGVLHVQRRNRKKRDRMDRETHHDRANVRQEAQA